MWWLRLLHLTLNKSLTIKLHHYQENNNKEWMHANKARLDKIHRPYVQLVLFESLAVLRCFASTRVNDN